MKDTDELLYEKGIVVRRPPGAESGKCADKPHMTVEEAVSWLRIWQDRNVPKHNLRFSKSVRNIITSGVESVYLNGMISELIERIRNGWSDPISTVAEYYCEMDVILAESDDDHFITHRFAGFMERAAHEVWMFLKIKEKELKR